MTTIDHRPYPDLSKPDMAAALEAARAFERAFHHTGAWFYLNKGEEQALREDLLRAARCLDLWMSDEPA